MESAMNQKQVVASLLAKANKYREFTLWVSDRETVHQILALAGELKQRALALARPDEEKIRKRAREIWEENSRPVGRDVEFWLQAEGEFREAEELANKIHDNIKS
jgi:Zn-dependent oligopeptidase